MTLFLKIYHTKGSNCSRDYDTANFYSFSLTPEAYQPSGTVGCSRLDPYKHNDYVKKWNILRILKRNL